MALGCISCIGIEEIGSDAQRARGTAVRMLTGQADGEVCNSGYRWAERCDALGATPPDVALALRRLHEGFAFVGLTDEWALSICLFHATHGGRCHAVEFANSRPTTSRTTRMPWLRNASTGYAATYARQVAEETARVHDPWDSALFAAAQARFRAAVRAAGLSRTRCEALCPEAPSGAFEGVTWSSVT